METFFPNPRSMKKKGRRQKPLPAAPEGRVREFSAPAKFFDVPGTAHARRFLEPPDGNDAEGAREKRIKHSSPHEPRPLSVRGCVPLLPDKAPDQEEKKDRIGGNRNELGELMEPEFRQVRIEPGFAEALPDEALKGEIKQMRREENEPGEEPCREEQPEKDLERRDRAAFCLRWKVCDVHLNRNPMYTNVMGDYRNAACGLGRPGSSASIVMVTICIPASGHKESRILALK